MKPGKAWRIRRTDLEAFLQESHRLNTLQGHLERFLTVPDQVLTVAEDAALLTQFDAAFFQVGEAHGGLMVKFYDPRATSRALLQAGLQQHGLDVASLEANGRLRWSPAKTMEAGVASLEHILGEEGGDPPIWAIFDWPSVGEMEGKLRQQTMVAELVAAHPRLVVSTGVVEPEPDAWPPLADQWQLLSSLRGLIRFARAGLLLSRVAKPVVS
jgi:hypothetical protein